MNRKTFLSSVAGFLGLSYIKQLEKDKAEIIERQKEWDEFNRRMAEKYVMPIDANFHVRGFIDGSKIVEADFGQLTRTMVSESDFVVFPKAET